MSGKKGALKKQWRGLVNFYIGHPGRFTGAILFSVCSAALSLMLPLVLSFIVDSVLNDGGNSLPGPLAALYESLGGRGWMIQNLWVAGAIILALTLVDGFLIFSYGKWISIFAEDGARRMRKSLFSHIQNLSFAYHAQAETGDLIQRCTSDVDTVRRFIGIPRCSRSCAAFR